MIPMTTAQEIIKNARLGNTHWGRRILNAARRGSFNETDQRLADRWTTCACGRTDARLLNENDGQEPWDSTLRSAGYDFGATVKVRSNSYSIRDAAYLLVKIEDRARQLTCELDQKS